MDEPQDIHFGSLERALARTESVKLPAPALSDVEVVHRSLEDIRLRGTCIEDNKGWTESPAANCQIGSRSSALKLIWPTEDQWPIHIVREEATDVTSSLATIDADGLAVLNDPDQLDAPLMRPQELRIIFGKIRQRSMGVPTNAQRRKETRSNVIAMIVSVLSVLAVIGLVIWGAVALAHHQDAMHARSAQQDAQDASHDDSDDYPNAPIVSAKVYAANNQVFIPDFTDQYDQADVGPLEGDRSRAIPTTKTRDINVRKVAGCSDWRAKIEPGDHYKVVQIGTIPTTVRIDPQFDLIQVCRPNTPAAAANDEGDVIIQRVAR